MLDRTVSLRRNNWLILLLCLLSFQTSCQSQRAPVEAQGLTPFQIVELYVRWIKAGEAEKAYALRTAEIRRNIDYLSFKEFVEQGKQTQPSSWETITSMQPLRETITSSTSAEVKVQYQREGLPEVMTIAFRKEDGIWKLGAFE